MTDSEQPAALRALNESWMYAISVADTKNGRVLARRPRAVELGLTMRLRAAPHIDYPGIYVVDSYRAFATPPELPSSLEDAMAQNPTYQRFLLSATQIGVVAMSMRLGYPERGSARLLPPANKKRIWLEMHCFDYEDTVDDGQLTTLHLAMLAKFDGDATAELPPEIAEYTFRHFIARTAFEA